MELSGDLLLRVSLESVVEKASELEKVLRGCKIAALHDNTSAHSLEGRDHLHGDNSDQHLCPPSPEGNIEGISAGLTTHWHRLSSYIVGLEKELQYYKQLVDDTQQQAEPARGGAAQVNATELPRTTARDHVNPAPEGRSSLQPMSVQSHPGQLDSQEKRAVFVADFHFWKKLLES